MVLRSARTRIRPWQFHDEDLADEWSAYNDPLEPLWNLPRQISDPQSWYGNFEPSAMRRSWAVEDQAGHLIGRISLREIDDAAKQARLGVTFGAPYVGQGLGTEALSVFLDYYFTELGFQVMVLDVAAPNQRAVRCYERLGFRYVGGDWREATSHFDSRILNDPQYEHLRQYFRPGPHRLEVQFFEMRLRKEEWFNHRQNGLSKN